MRYLRQSTATVQYVGPFPNKVTAMPLSGLPDQSAYAQVLRDDGASGFVAASWEAGEGGIYWVGFGESHTSRLGTFRLEFANDELYLPVWEDFSVVPRYSFDLAFGLPSPPIIPGSSLFRPRMEMIPFDDLMFTDDLVIYRSTPVTNTEGQSVRVVSNQGEPTIASVQRRDGNRMDSADMTIVSTAYMIYTPTNIALGPDDKIAWSGRNLTVQVGTMPEGMGDVIFKTVCMESE